MRLRGRDLRWEQGLKRAVDGRPGQPRIAGTKLAECRLLGVRVRVAALPGEATQPSSASSAPTITAPTLYAAADRGASQSEARWHSRIHLHRGVPPSAHRGDDATAVEWLARARGAAVQCTGAVYRGHCPGRQRSRVRYWTVLRVVRPRGTLRPELAEREEEPVHVLATAAQAQARAHRGLAVSEPGQQRVGAELPVSHADCVLGRQVGRDERRRNTQAR